MNDFAVKLNRCHSDGATEYSQRNSGWRLSPYTSFVSKNQPLICGVYERSITTAMTFKLYTHGLKYNVQVGQTITDRKEFSVWRMSLSSNRANRRCLCWRTAVMHLYLLKNAAATGHFQVLIMLDTYKNTSHCSADRFSSISERYARVSSLKQLASTTIIGYKCLL